MRRALLSILPKVFISRLTGLLARIPLPSLFRGPFLRWFAGRYGADLGEMEGELGDYRSLAAFFQRPLKPGARPIADTPLVWPCDGRIVSSGPVEDGKIPQVKGVDYAVEELLGAPFSAASQATIYLAPRDYHRVHIPFDAEVSATRRIRGTLFPVNGPAVAAIPKLFVRNARTVFTCKLASGHAAALVMVGALNVGDISVSCAVPSKLAKGDEIGRFGFGSTVVVLIEDGGPAFASLEPGTVVRIGARSSPDPE